MNNNLNLNNGNVNGPTPNTIGAPQMPNPSVMPQANGVPNPNVTAPAPQQNTTPPVQMPNTPPAVNPGQPAPAALGQMPNNNTLGAALQPTPQPQANPQVGAQQQMPGQAPNIAVPGAIPTQQNPNMLQGIAPAQPTPSTPVQNSPMPNPVMPNNGQPAPNNNSEDDGKKKIDAKTIILVIAAILSIVVCVLYFMFLNPNKKKPAPTDNNTTENVNNNNTATETNTENNTSDEPEAPEEIADYDMSWMGEYTADDVIIDIYYSAPKVIELEVQKKCDAGVQTATISIDVTSTSKLTYEDDSFGETIAMDLTKTEDGITINSESSDEDSALNLSGDYAKVENDDSDWAGFYEVDGNQIIISELSKNSGRLYISSKENSSSIISYEVKNNAITIAAKSFTKDDTVIKKDGDKLIVTSDEYTAGTYTKLK